MKMIDEKEATSSDNNLLLIAELAAKIAKKANECCHRSDGWEEAMKNYIEDSMNKYFGANNNG